MISQLSYFVKTNYIKGKYYSQEGIWQLLHPKHFDNALLIHHLEGRGEKVISNTAALMKEGLVDCTNLLPQPDNVETESDSVIRSHNIVVAFKPFEKHDGTTVTPEVIIISGAPGMGKTTLCKEMAYQWAKGQFLDNSCLMFFVYLRDPQTQKICDLQSFIHYFHNFDKAAAEFSKQCADVLIERDNKDVTILLVGFDEYFDVSGDLFLTAILNKKVACFAQSKLVITCGPIATDKLQRVADVKVDLLGFIDKSKKAYIQKELQDSPNKIEKLSLFLDENSIINSICSVPMIMSILVYTFKEVDELPADQTELYEHFIVLTISQYLKKLDNSPDFKVLHLQHLPECYQQYVVELSKLAFTLKDNNKSVFTQEDLETLCPSVASANKRFQELGLLKSAFYFSMKRISKCYSYKFLHLAIQEFLATYYINSLTPSIQFDLLKKTFFIKKYADTGLLFVKNCNKNVMFEFFEYLIHGTPCEELQFKAVPSIVDLDPFQAFTQLAKICTTDSSLAHSKLLCYKNSEAQLYKTDDSNSVENYVLFSKLAAVKVEWNKVYLSVCSARNSDSQSLETFVIDKSKQEGVYVKLATHLNQNTSLSVVIINVVSMAAYRATKRQIIDGYNINDSISHLMMSQCDIDEETAETMSQYFSKSHMETAVFFGCTFNGFGQKIIFNGFSCISTLKIFIIENANIDETTTIALSKVIANNSELYQLGLCNCNLQKKACVIATSLKNISTVLTLNLSNNKIPGSVADDLAIALYINCKVRRLHLANNNLQHQGGTVVASALCHIKTLVELNLSNNRMTEKVADELSLAIESNKSLQVLCIGGNDLRSDGIIRISQSISSLSNLRVLEMADNQITESASQAIANAVSSNHGLEQLYLGRNKLRTGALKIAIGLLNISSLKLLDLTDNELSTVVASKIASVITTNSLLEELRLRNNKLTTSGIITIAQSLSNISTLKILDIINNHITEEAAIAIASLILRNDTLEELCVGDNDLRAGVVTIVESLQNVSTLKKLYLDNTSVPDKMWMKLASVLKNIHLTVLNLSYNCLQLSGKFVAQALSKLNTLTHLYLHDCYMTNKAANSLAAAITSNCSLKALVLRNNQLQTSGVISICQSLNHLSTLQEFNISCNEVTEQGAYAIASVVFNNIELKQLFLGDNKLHNSTAQIMRALQTVSSISFLYLSYMEMTDSIAPALEAAINSNHLLEELCVAGNFLSNSLVNVIKACKRSVKNLIALDLRCNLVTPSKISYLASVISSIHTLKALFIGGLVVSNNEKFFFNCILKFEQFHPHDNTFDMNLNKEYEILDILTSESQRETIQNYIKLNYYNNDGLLFIFADPMTDLFNGHLINKYDYLNIKLQGVKQSLSQVDAATIIYLLPVISKLKALDMEQSNIDEVAAFELGAILSCNNVLEQLWLAGNQLGITGAMFILNSLEHMSTLAVLDLSFNNIGWQSAESVTAVIKSNPNLEQLWLDGNSLLDIGVKQICLAMQCGSKLRILSLCSNGITDDGAEELNNAIFANNILEDVSLGNNKLQSVGICTLVRSLSNLCKLRILDLFHNGVDKDVAGELAVLISNCYALQTLYLSDNMLGTEGAIKIFESLKHKSKLQVLTLSNNNITDEAIDELCLVLAQNPRLQVLLLGGNKLQTDGVVRIAQVVKIKNTIMHLLGLCGNNISEQGKEEIENMFSDNTLIHVYM